MGKRHSKKTTGREREKKRKAKIQKRLTKALGINSSSSSSSSSSSNDYDPRQNSQIRRALRRAALRMQYAEAINNPGGANSSSSNDTWAVKAASIASALGSVLTAVPPKAAGGMPAIPVLQQGLGALPLAPPAVSPLPTPNFPPVHPHLQPAFTAEAINMRAVPQTPHGVLVQQPKSPPPKATTQAPPPKAQAKVSAGAMEMASLYDNWHLDLRHCNRCNQWTYYRNGICINKQCPLNQLLICIISV